MFLPSVLLIFAVASRSASIEEVPFYETQVHPLSDEYIEYINNVQSLWQAGRNFEIDTPIEYLSHLNGAIHKDGLLALNEKEFSEDMIQNLPESFDARKQWPHCPSLSEIRNQGQCGSCWAMSSTEVMTDRTCIASHGKVEFHYSTFDLLTCCVNNTASCDGGDADKAWQHWLDVGIVSGGNYNSKNKGCKPYPYANTNLERNDLTQLDSWEISLNCTHQCVSADLDYNKDKRFGKSIYRLRSKEDDIKTDILNHGPVQACFHEFQDFMSYKSGVYRAVSNISAGYHCAKILGWGLERGTKYWLVANSWGEQWGDHGYFKFVRGENHCGIESEVYAGEPLL